MPGVARRPVTFFASPKKVTQKRRPQAAGPSGFPFVQIKNGKRTKLASLKQRSLLFPFSAPHKRQRHSGKNNGNFKNYLAQ